MTRDLGYPAKEAPGGSCRRVRVTPKAANSILNQAATQAVFVVVRAHSAHYGDGAVASAARRSWRSRQIRNKPLAMTSAPPRITRSDGSLLQRSQSIATP